MIYFSIAHEFDTTSGSFGVNGTLTGSTGFIVQMQAATRSYAGGALEDFGAKMRLAAFSGVAIGGQQQ
jgi:hypothetical protein